MSESDSKAQGFGYPEDQVTEPCLIYMARIMELREFVSFYFNFVKSSSKLKNLIPVAENPEPGGGTFELLKYEHSAYQQLTNQIMLSRAVESFDLYLTTILRDIFLSRPQLLKSEGTVDIASVIDAVSHEDLIWQIVERKVHELSYKSLADLRKFVQSRTGIDLFPDEEAFEMTILASEIRNLIAHNDCRANNIFRTKTAGLKLAASLTTTGFVKIEDEWLRRASYTLDGLVFRFDQLALPKFDLKLFNRMSSFTLRA